MIEPTLEIREGQKAVKTCLKGTEKWVEGKRKAGHSRWSQRLKGCRARTVPGGDADQMKGY